MFSINKDHDVLGTDVSDLKSVPGSIKAIILLLPKDEKYKERLEEKNSNVGVSPSQFFNIFCIFKIIFRSQKYFSFTKKMGIFVEPQH